MNTVLDGVDRFAARRRETQIANAPVALAEILEALQPLWTAEGREPDTDLLTIMGHLHLVIDNRMFCLSPDLISVNAIVSAYLEVHGKLFEARLREATFGPDPMPIEYPEDVC